MSMMEWAKREVEIASKRERGDKPERRRKSNGIKELNSSSTG